MNEDQCFLQLRPDKSGILSLLVQVVIWFELVIAAGLSRPGKSREGPGTGQDRTGPRDLEGPVVPWSRDQRSPKVPGLENGKVPEKMPTLIMSLE